MTTRMTLCRRRKRVSHSVRRGPPQLPAPRADRARWEAGPVAVAGGRPQDTPSRSPYQLEDKRTGDRAAALTPWTRRSVHPLLRVSRGRGRVCCGGCSTTRTAIRHASPGRLLEICHFDPETGEDRRRSSRSGRPRTARRRATTASCSYTNQPVPRPASTARRIKDVLLRMGTLAGGGRPRRPDAGGPPSRLCGRLAGSDLERQWLAHLDWSGAGFRLPSHAQHYRRAPAAPRPTSSTASYQTAVYIDGPPHDFPDRQRRDSPTMTEAMEDAGYSVIRFHHQDDWAVFPGTLPPPLREAVMSFAIGALVQGSRGREWVVLPESTR